MEAKLMDATKLQRWLNTTLSRNGGDILLIQTLRNVIMAASVLASAALVAQVAVLASAQHLTKNTIMGLAMLLAICASLAILCIVRFASCGFLLQHQDLDNSKLAIRITSALRLIKASALLLMLALCLAAVSGLF